MVDRGASLRGGFPRHRGQGDELGRPTIAEASHQRSVTACQTVPELTPPCEVGRCLLRSSKHAVRSVLLSPQQGGTLAAAICETTGQTGESPRG
jgi:hypothetical protein